MRLLSFLVLASLLVSCKDQSFLPTAHYQLAVSPSGQIYRLNSYTGEIALIEQSKVSSVSGPTRLAVGSLYETENGEVLRYVGEGKFKPRPPLSSFIKKSP